jgi:hypothetical protein
MQPWATAGCCSRLAIRLGKDSGARFGGAADANGQREGREVAGAEGEEGLKQARISIWGRAIAVLDTVRASLAR